MQGRKIGLSGENSNFRPLSR